MKYISFEIDGMPRVATVTFPDFLNHSEVSKYISLLMRRTLDADEVKPVSAGFCNIQDVVCFGESESLRLKSDHMRDEMSLEGR